MRQTCLKLLGAERMREVMGEKTENSHACSEMMEQRSYEVRLSVPVGKISGGCLFHR